MSEQVNQTTKDPQISRKYSLGFLVTHPVSQPVVLKHLAPLGLDKAQLAHNDGTLRDMFEMNMGGGIPYSIIKALMLELDRLPNAAFEGTTVKG